MSLRFSKYAGARDRIDVSLRATSTMSGLDDCVRTHGKICEQGLAHLLELPGHVTVHPHET